MKNYVLLNNQREMGNNMREIKFRAWDKKSKKMRAVNSVAFHYEHETFDGDNSRLPKVVNVWGHDIIEDKSIILHREIREVELLEFTGLHDKNGKEIYEGDILHQDLYQDMYCVWDEENAQIRFLDTNWVVSQGHPFYRTRESLVHWEIIGNVYENPELLKVKENE